jgi:hypothetical protein
LKKVIDISAIEAREKELTDELVKLRALKRYATKFGADYGETSENAQNLLQNEVPEPEIALHLKAMIGTFTDEFNYQTIEKCVAQSNVKISRSSIFEFLSKMKESGEIETVRPGAGRRPAQFKLTDKFMPF